MNSNIINVTVARTVSGQMHEKEHKFPYEDEEAYRGVYKTADKKFKELVEAEVEWACEHEVENTTIAMLIRGQILKEVSFQSINNK